MSLSRRNLLAGIATLPALVPQMRPAAAQTLAGDNAIPPMLFVHGNGDAAPIWMTTLWRMESNDIARERMFAINFTDPLARTDDSVAQPNRSSTDDQRRELSDAIDGLKRRTGAPRVALIGNSRGGNAIRNYIKNGGAPNVSHAILGGTPNHGINTWPDNRGNEFNGAGPFLSGLNGGDSEVVPGVAFLTLRSDGYDKYAQPDGRFVGKPGMPTGVTFEGPELRGATNLVLGDVDHRETAFSPRAFREIYKFIAGREPAQVTVTPQRQVTISGIVTGSAEGAPTNRPVADASLQIYRVAPDTGERISGEIHMSGTGNDGRWGPTQVSSDWCLEFVLSMPGAPTTHYYRSPFLRSTDILHLRAGRALGKADAGAAGVVIMSRVRGYFGLPRDVVLLDGKEPTDVKTGVPTDSITTLRLGPGDIGRPVAALFNEEKIVARSWPAAENRIVIAELTS